MKLYWKKKLSEFLIIEVYINSESIPVIFRAKAKAVDKKTNAERYLRYYYDTYNYRELADNLKANGYLRVPEYPGEETESNLMETWI